MGLRRTRERQNRSSMEWWLEQPRWVRVGLPLLIILFSVFWWLLTGLVLLEGFVGVGRCLSSVFCLTD